LHIFDFLFNCLFSYLYIRVLKLTLVKIIIFTNFPLFSAFQCEAPGQTWLIVQTHRVLSIVSLASGLSECIGNTSRRDPYKYFSAAFFLSQPHTTTFLLIFHVMLCVFLADFSRDFGILCTSLLIPW
jgi:hypothetical protein